MTASLRRRIGFIMIFAAIISLLISAFFLVQVWRTRLPLTNLVVENLDLLFATTLTTDDSLLLIESTLTDLLTSTDTLQRTTITVAQSIHDTSLMADSIASIVGNDIPLVIAETQTAVSSAQASAVVIDNVLNALASIPLIGIDYHPGVPLNVALGQVSSSLESLPTSLEQVRGELDSTHTNLLGLEEKIYQINLDIQETASNLYLAQVVIDEYQREIAQLETKLDHSRNSAPEWMLSAAWVLTFVIIWFSISQMGILLQGYDMLTVKRSDIKQANQPSEIE